MLRSLEGHVRDGSPGSLQHVEVFLIVLAVPGSVLKSVGGSSRTISIRWLRSLLRPIGGHDSTD